MIICRRKRGTFGPFLSFERRFCVTGAGHWTLAYTRGRHDTFGMLLKDAKTLTSVGRN